MFADCCSRQCTKILWYKKYQACHAQILPKRISQILPLLLDEIHLTERWANVLLTLCQLLADLPVRRLCFFQDPKMKILNSNFFLLLLFLGSTQAAIAMQENHYQIATEVNFWFERDVLNLNLMPPPISGGGQGGSGGGQGGGVQGEVLRGLQLPGQYCLLPSSLCC